MFIEITGVDLKQFIREMYALSVPLGLGFLHARLGDLDNATTDAIVAEVAAMNVINMDYVRGARMFIFGRWPDHSEHDLDELLRRVGINKPHNLVAELPT